MPQPKSNLENQLNWLRCVLSKVIWVSRMTNVTSKFSFNAGCQVQIKLKPQITIRRRPCSLCIYSSDKGKIHRKVVDDVKPVIVFIGRPSCENHTEMHTQREMQITIFVVRPTLDTNAVTIRLVRFKSSTNCVVAPSSRLYDYDHSSITIWPTINFDPRCQLMLLTPFLLCAIAKWQKPWAFMIVWKRVY